MAVMAVDTCAILAESGEEDFNYGGNNNFGDGEEEVEAG